MYEHVLSLVTKNIDAFVLPPDNTIYSAIDAVVKVAESRNIPVIMGDIFHTEDGILAAIGYNYVLSGIQAAHITDRILRKGENPKDIPFQQYSGLETMVNRDLADQRGLTIPDTIIENADIVISQGKVSRKVK